MCQNNGSHAFVVISAAAESLTSQDFGVLSYTLSLHLTEPHIRHLRPVAPLVTEITSTVGREGCESNGFLPFAKSCEVQCKRGHRFFGGSTTYGCYQQLQAATLSCGDFDPEELARARQPWMTTNPETQAGGHARMPLCSNEGSYEGECLGERPF